MESDVKIVIGEDDENHALLIRKNLERVGLKNEILHFVNGEEVLLYFESVINGKNNLTTRHVLLLDVKMPRVDGIEVLRKMKSHPVLKKVPIIMLTTTDNPEEMAQCHNLGCNNYIIKPVNYERFVQVISSLGTYLKIIKVPYPK